MLSKSFFFVACLLIPSGAMGQTGQLEIKNPWARATPDARPRRKRRSLSHDRFADRRSPDRCLFPGRQEGCVAHDVDAGRRDENAAARRD
jgi:hypothetical protein